MYTIRIATPADEAHIADFVAQHHMVAPVFGASSWWVACDQRGAVCGTIGAEYSTTAWLLRSAVVAQQARGHGVGGALTHRLIHAARHQHISAVYCFSTDAGDFWQHMGFVEVPVAELLAALPQAPQVAQFAALGWLATEVAWRYDVGH